MGLIAACGVHDGTAPPEDVGSAKESLGPTASVSINITFPAGYGLSASAVGAAGSLEIDNNAKILAENGSPGVATNSGQGTTTLKNDVSVGTIASVGNVQVGNHVVASSVVSGGSIALGNGEAIGKNSPHAMLTPLVHRTMTYHSSATPSDLTVAPKSTESITPGRYGNVVAKPNSTLKLSTGTYLLDSLDVEPNATLELDTSRGTITVYVQNAVTWKGATNGDPARFVFAYMGADTLSLQGPLGGTVLVPQGTLELGNGSYRGTFYGKNVVVKPNVTVTQVAPPTLIDGISVSSTTLCAGEPTEVTLQTANVSGATAWVQGVVGAHQFVEFDGLPGDRYVFATTFTPDGKADFVSVPVTIQSCELGCPRFCGQGHYARFFVDCNINSYSMGLI